MLGVVWRWFVNIVRHITLPEKEVEREHNNARGGGGGWREGLVEWGGVGREGEGR